MPRKRKTRPGEQEIELLSFDIMLRELYALVEKLEGRRFGDRQLSNFMSKLNLDIDPRVIQKVREGHGVSEEKYKDIAQGISKRIEMFVEREGGARELVETFAARVEEDQSRALEYLLARFKEGKPPFVYDGDLKLNRDDRHLVDEYMIELAVGPTPASQIVVEYPDREEKRFDFETIALINYTLQFSAINRNYSPNFRLRYATNLGDVALSHPKVDDLVDPQGYKRQRTTLVYLPDPRNPSPQRMTFFVRGGYDPGNEDRASEERAHFSFLQPALYRKVRFVLDLSLYPEDSIAEQPTLFVVSKLEGFEFDCCKMAKDGLGQRPKPLDDNHEGTRRYTWELREFNGDKMIGVHWRIDQSKLSTGNQTTEEQLLSLLDINNG